jgi:hypothetical protein
MLLTNALLRQLGLQSSSASSESTLNEINNAGGEVTPQLEYRRIYSRDSSNKLLYEGQTIAGTRIKHGEGRLYDPQTGHL